MKRRKTILCTILVLLAVSLAGLFWWQRDNLKAIHAATQHTSAELEEKLEENQQMIQEAVKAAGEVTVGEISEEDRQAFRDGSMTQEELVERLTNGGEGETREEPASTSHSESGGKTDAPVAKTDTPAVSEKSEQSAESAYQKELSALIAKVYVLREEYTLALDTMYADAKAEYLALPAEKRTKTQLLKMARGYLSRASALEKECDGKMDEIVRAMEKLLRENDGDLGLVDTVVYTYANEKSLKKSWYMSKLEQKGLL